MRLLHSIFLLIFSFSALLGQEKLQVIATASMIADMAQNIAGEELEIISIVPIGSDPHTYEPKPSDAKLVAEASLILMNGLTFEGWLGELIENSGTSAKVVTVTEGIEPIASAVYKNAPDPHAWMDVSKGQFYIENIKNAFIKLLPEKQAVFEANYANYRQQLEETDRYVTQKMEEIPDKQRILITSHDAFQYFGRRYGIRLESVLGTSTEADVQISDIIRVGKVIKKFQVPAVFIESTIAPKFLEQLASDHEIKIGGKLYSDSLGKKGSGASTYLDMLRHNANTINNALKQSFTVKATNDSEPSDSSGSNWWLLLLIGALCLGGFYFVFRNLNR